ISAQSSTASIPSVLPGSDTARVTDQVVRFELPRGGHFSRAADTKILNLPDTVWINQPTNTPTAQEKAATEAA
ncbi:hypothetical protein C5E45_34560, partial [Nocardia nova]